MYLHGDRQKALDPLLTSILILQLFITIDSRFLNLDIMHVVHRTHSITAYFSGLATCTMILGIPILSVPTLIELTSSLRSNYALDRDTMP